MRFYIGLDLGKLRSATAVCVVERQERVAGRDPATMAWRVERRLRLRYAGRMAAGTGYLEAVAAVRQLVERAGVRGACEVVADASGVGEAVVEVMRKQAGVRVKAVRIKSGGKTRECGAEVSVTRGELVEALALEAERGTLHVAGAAGEWEKLREEMAALRREKRGREGGDDLAMALALAVWGARKGWLGAEGRGPYLRVGKTEEEMRADLGVKPGPVAWRL